ncbi:nucleoid-associated protein [Psychromonas sp. SR45-3]|uniref:nucleoid-associated protein n=1 Tax=Psychromonas sp. SR45-3 TaxID=2760930 RepID=UPI0015F82508|nr:hypothetical protein [Psychromonas sp. SR45-3]MBB1273983.1 hypothetical protein [Psychromonas sp. SR45-3]
MANERPLVINQVMRDSIKIHDFIYHILITSAEEVDYLQQVTLTPKQTNFFKDMIAESSRGTKYEFIDKQRSSIFNDCSIIIDNPDDDDFFINQSEIIAKNFKEKHDKRMADGIVIVTVFSMEVNLKRVRFIAILKLDYKPVLQQVRDPIKPKHVIFNEITDTLLEDKSAIQKRAIIDISESFKWDVIAVERSKTAAEQDTETAIGEHFSTFLNVRLLMNNSTSTRKAISHVFVWAKQQEDIIPTDIKARVIHYIEAHNEQNITMDDIRDLVCNHEDDNRKVKLTNSFNAFMDEVDFSGVQFTAMQNSIPPSEKKSKVKTNKNVIIEWQGERQDAGISIVTKAGKTTITIIADNLDDLTK